MKILWYFGVRIETSLVILVKVIVIQCIEIFYHSNSELFLSKFLYFVIESSLSSLLFYYSIWAKEYNISILNSYHCHPSPYTTTPPTHTHTHKYSNELHVWRQKKFLNFNTLSICFIYFKNLSNITETSLTIYV